MLRMMREHATSWFIKIILGAIVIVFVLWGVGNYGAQRESRVALVNGQPITVDEYRGAYNNLMERYRQLYGENFNNDMIKMLNLEQQALDSLIDQRLLLQEAESLDFRVSDEELAAAIRNFEAFQRDGRFDRRLYLNLLSRNRLTPETFEVNQRQALLAEKVRSFIMDSVKVSENEAFEYYQWNNATMKLDYVLFEPSRYEDIEPTDAETEAHYEENKENYKTDPMVKVQYLRFPAEDFVDRVEVPEEEIEAYYMENPEAFESPKTVEARHILIKTGEADPPEVVEEKKSRALEIMEKARSGEDFAELAKAHSEGPSKEKGGLLGAFKREDMVKPFSDKAFSMAPGEISEPVLTQFGWHIIKVEKVNEASTTPLEEAEETIRKRLARDRADILAYDEAESVFMAAYEGDDLGELAEARDLDLTSTDFLTRSGTVKGVGDSRAFLSAAFELPVMEISDIKDLKDGYYLLQVTEKIEAETADLADVRAEVKADLVSKRRMERAEAEAEALLKAVREKDATLSEAAEISGLTLRTTEPFKRQDAIPGIGYEREIARKAFELSPEKKYPQAPLKGRKGYYVIAFNERKAPDTEAFKAEETEVRDRLLQQKRVRTFNTWLAQVKSRSEIERLTN